MLLLFFFVVAAPLFKRPTAPSFQIGYR